MSSAHHREKKEGSGGRETRGASGEEGDDGGCHGYKDGGWISTDLRGVRGWNATALEREQSLPAVDVVMAWYVGTILTDKEYQSLLSRTLQLAVLTFIPE